ncbi:MAG: STAS domain-containing protein [Bdellovibrionales bacterium]|nr:STAS domain-containing protein [Bdellovibrionales bacterium]
MGKKRNLNLDSQILKLSGRVDSFRFDEVKDQIAKYVDEGPEAVALDLSNVDFLSLAIIKFFGEVAHSLQLEGRELILLGLSEKLKRQVDLYASLDGMMIYRNAGDWKHQTTHLS